MSGWRVDPEGKEGMLVISGLGSIVSVDNVRTALSQFTEVKRISCCERAAEDPGHRRPQRTMVVDVGGLAPARRLAEQFNDHFFMIGGMPRPVKAEAVECDFEAAKAAAARAEQSAADGDTVSAEPANDAEAAWAHRVAKLLRQQALEREVMAERALHAEYKLHNQQRRQHEDQLLNSKDIEELVKSHPLAKLSRLHGDSPPRRWKRVERDLQGGRDPRWRW